MQSPCSLYLCESPSITFWMPEPVFMKLGMFVMTPAWEKRYRYNEYASNYRRIVGLVIFCAVRVVSKERRPLILSFISVLHYVPLFVVVFSCSFLWIFVLQETQISLLPDSELIWDNRTFRTHRTRLMAGGLSFAVANCMELSPSWEATSSSDT
jgi:hypothetical protein